MPMLGKVCVRMSPDTAFMLMFVCRLCAFPCACLDEATSALHASTYTRFITDPIHVEANLRAGTTTTHEHSARTRDSTSAQEHSTHAQDDISSHAHIPSSHASMPPSYASIPSQHDTPPALATLTRVREETKEEAHLRSRWRMLATCGS